MFIETTYHPTWSSDKPVGTPRPKSFVQPFPTASGPATEKPTRDLGRVPGAPERATTKYDVAQVLSFVATHRTNTEERVTWQAEIPNLLKGLPVSTTVRTP